MLISGKFDWASAALGRILAILGFPTKCEGVAGGHGGRAQGKASAGN
jgi:hypothetical protein